MGIGHEANDQAWILPRPRMTCPAKLDPEGGKRRTGRGGAYNRREERRTPTSALPFRGPQSLGLSALSRALSPIAKVAGTVQLVPPASQADSIMGKLAKRCDYQRMSAEEGQARTQYVLASARSPRVRTRFTPASEGRCPCCLQQNRLRFRAARKQGDRDLQKLDMPVRPS